MKFEKKALEGRYIRLEPISIIHKEGLCEAIADGELWKLFVTLVPNLDKVSDFIGEAENSFENMDGITYAIIESSTDKIVGSTRFMKANLENKRVEIGYTFVAKSFQRTSVNTEAKLLMLSYGFERLGLNRVEFLTEYLNIKSREAWLRIGAKEEGILRNHMVMPNGRVRDSVVFSVIKNEWSGVKQNLLEKLA